MISSSKPHTAPQDKTVINKSSKQIGKDECMILHVQNIKSVSFHLICGRNRIKMSDAELIVNLQNT